MRKIIVFVAAMLIAGLVFVPNSVSALSGTDFKPGRIIDDAVFYDGNSMDTATIQQFLNAKVPTCDINGTQLTTHPNSSGGFYTRAQWGASNNNPAPFTCLKDLRQDVQAKPAEAGLCKGLEAGNKSAAQIIQEVGVSCGVSPKVLLVQLQKEQALITDDWPWTTQYKTAMGFGCPDVMACDNQYSGFANQTYAVARQFKFDQQHPEYFNVIAGRHNYIQYNPNSSCGGSQVFIENQATAGLYIYTPYQPNQASLASLYGSGDACSAYGNRNFWRYFNDWFGSTLAPTQQPTAALSINGKDDASVAYGSTITISWTSKNAKDCSIQPGSNSGTEGSKQISNVTQTAQYAMECVSASGLKAVDKATVEVAAPTFSYLKDFLAGIALKQGKTSLSTKSETNMVELAEKKYKAGLNDDSKLQLQKSVTSLDGIVANNKLAPNVANDYRKAVDALVISWTAPKVQLSISSDGCTINAVAPAGYVLDYGAHDGAWQRGMSDSVTIADTGVAIAQTGAVKGMTTYANLKDTSGKLLLARTAVVSAETCPLPQNATPPVLTTPTPSTPPASSEPVIGPVGTGVNCGGGYPAKWCEVPMDSVIDSWGMYNRENVSYSAFKAHMDYLAGRNSRDMPYWGGVGNANQWDDNARAAGIPVDETPTPGSIAVSNAGVYGHTMYVEQVGTINGQQAIYVSQYSANFDGRYSEGWRYTTGLVFIHF